MIGFQCDLSFPSIVRPCTTLITLYLCPPGDAVCAWSERQEALQDVYTAAGEELHHVVDSLRRRPETPPSRRVLPAISGGHGGVCQGRHTETHGHALSHGTRTPCLRPSLAVISHGTTFPSKSSRQTVRG